MKFSRVVFCDFDERPTEANASKLLRNAGAFLVPFAERRLCPLGCKGMREFDGTITTEDTFVAVLEKFAPAVSARLLSIIFERKMTLKEGMKKTLGSISSTYYPEIIDHIAHRPIRPGLKEFADFLNNLNIPLVIISGGLMDIVQAVLEEQQLIDQITAIYAAEVNTTAKLLQVHSKFEGDTELVAKVKVMAQHPSAEKIAIRDSVTDINMALAADLVFARNCGCEASPSDSASRRHRLVGYLDAEQKSYVKWQDFFDIRDHLASQWQVQ